MTGRAESSLLKATSRKLRGTLSMVWVFWNLPAHFQWHKTNPPNPSQPGPLAGEVFKCMNFWEPSALKSWHPQVKIALTSLKETPLYSKWRPLRKAIIRHMQRSADHQESSTNHYIFNTTPALKGQGRGIGKIGKAREPGSLLQTVSPRNGCLKKPWTTVISTDMLARKEKSLTGHNPRQSTSRI